jgi:diadenosine tetraphosphate (Ap4A) HIT family hydrolase
MSCYICENNANLGHLPARESILVEGGWRIGHAFDSSLAGWLVLVPLRHVLALHELGVSESRTLGDLLRRTTQALRQVTGCEKTYAMLFAEAEGFAHLHFHVVPRMPAFDTTVVGPNIFALLNRPVGERLSEQEQDEIARRVGSALEKQVGL